MINSDRMYHIGLTKKDLKGAEYAILPGDPGRVPKIAEYLDNPCHLTTNREYNSYLGSINGQNVLVISTGIGGPSTAICVEELAQIGIKNIIRVGTSGGMQLNVNPGDIVIASGAVRDGTSKEYVPVDFPAVANIDLVIALQEASKKLGYPYHVGVVHCKDSFYGQHSPDRMPVSYELNQKWQAYIKAGALCSEMESATLYTVASTLGIKAATILLVIWNQEIEKQGRTMQQNFNVDEEIEVAITAIKDLIGTKNE